jgi:hypothetical protein
VRMRAYRKQRVQCSLLLGSTTYGNLMSPGIVITGNRLGSCVATRTLGPRPYAPGLG